MRRIKDVTENTDEICMVGKYQMPRYMYKELTVATLAPICYPEELGEIRSTSESETHWAVAN